MHQQYLDGLKQAHQKQTLESFLQFAFEHDPTNRDFTDPVWVSVLELIESKVPKKQIYTVSVSEAAKQKDCTLDTIRKAIGRQEIRAIKDGGRWRIDPQSLKSWSRHRDHKTYVLEARFGNEKGARLSLRVNRAMVEQTEHIEGNIHEATIEDWQDAGILTASGKSRRFWRITPGGAKIQSIEHGSFYVEGCFQIEEQYNNTEDAKEAWRLYSNQS